MCHTTGSSVLWYTPVIQRHLIDGYTQRKRNDLRTQTTGSNILQSNWNGWGSGSTGHSCPGLKMISSLKTDAQWDFLEAPHSVNQPKPQDSKTFRIDIIHWCVSMTLGNKAYISDIHNSIFSVLEADAACLPPKMSIQFCPTVMLKSIYNEIKVLINKITQSAIIF
jgi:hypothetical protein